MTAVTNRAELTNPPLERYQLGEVVSYNQVDPQDLGIEAHLAPSRVFEVETSDPYVDRYTEAEQADVRRVEFEAHSFAEQRRLNGLWERKADTAYVDGNGDQQRKKSWGDPVSRDRFFVDTLGSPAIDAWKSKIPSAEALADLSDPINTNVVTDKRGREFPLDDLGRKWLSLCTDAIAIRSRATVMANAVKEFAEQQKISTGTNLDNFRWLSVACGTALPSMQGAMRAGIKPELLLADFDNKAMDATEKLAADIGYDGRITRPAQEALGKDDVNIFDDIEMAKLREYFGSNGGRPMLIDLMGIFEYTGDNLGVDSAKFLRTCYDMLHPGGRLVFGQMRSDRPVPDFTMGVVSWPYVEMRSPKEFMEIIQEAGIPVKATQLYLPKDGVYTVGVIDKPQVPEQFAVN